MPGLHKTQWRRQILMGHGRIYGMVTKVFCAENDWGATMYIYSGTPSTVIVMPEGSPIPKGCPIAVMALSVLRSL